MWLISTAQTFQRCQMAADLSGPVPSGGVMAYSAFDENNVYVAVSNQGSNFFSRPGEGHVEPAFESMTNGIGNGSITALDLKTGEGQVGA